jgi:hypothetical protein
MERKVWYGNLENDLDLFYIAKNARGWVELRRYKDIKTGDRVF